MIDMKYITLFTFLFYSYNISAKNQSPFLVVLGIAQDAGYPQAGCYKPHCMPGWKDINQRLGAVSLGLVDSKSSKKYLIEATPDLPSQLYQLHAIAPDNEFKLSGVFLTHAHIGHYTGLMFLGHEAMGTMNMPVYVMPRMKQFLETNGPWSQLVNFNNITLSELHNKTEKKLGELTISPFLVPHRDEFSETVGYEIQGPKKSAVFIPDINKWEIWDYKLSDVIQKSDYALIDASFFANGEIPGRDMSLIPHPFVTETMDLLKNLPLKEKNKVWFIHMNHTNPMLNPDSQESKIVESNGYNIAREGDRFVL